MADVDASVLSAIEAQLLDPRVVKRALAHAEQAIARDRKATDVDGIHADLLECERAIRRLTSAIASGGDIPTLVSALQLQGVTRQSCGRGWIGAHAETGA